MFNPISLPKRSAWASQILVIKALFHREVITRFGEYQLGFVWMLLEPLLSVLIIGFLIGSFGGRAVPEIPYPFFVLNGKLLLNLFTGRIIEETRPAADAKEEDRPEGYLNSKATVKVPKFSRRTELARAVTEDNPLLARSFVNYTWALLLGRGMVHPVDEMNSKHPPSHPQLLNWLASDFATHNYDTRRLVRAIVLSRGYQLAAWKGPKAPAPDAFAAAIEKPLTAETMARSARIASGRPADDDALRKVFVETFPDVLPRVTRATIQQSMMLANSEVLAGLFQPEPGTAAERLARVPGVEERAREIFRV